MSEPVYLLTIRWGQIEGEGPIITYSFESQRAREAFLNGVEEGTGWMDHRVLDEDDPRFGTDGYEEYRGNAWVPNDN